MKNRRNNTGWSDRWPLLSNVLYLVAIVAMIWAIVYGDYKLNPSAYAWSFSQGLHSLRQLFH